MTLLEPCDSFVTCLHAYTLGCLSVLTFVAFIYVFIKLNQSRQKPGKPDIIVLLLSAGQALLGAFYYGFFESEQVILFVRFLKVLQTLVICWIFAAAAVPGGHFTRCRTHWLFSVFTGCLLILYTGISRDSSPNSKACRNASWLWLSGSWVIFAWSAVVVGIQIRRGLLQGGGEVASVFYGPIAPKEIGGDMISTTPPLRKSYSCPSGAAANIVSNIIPDNASDGSIDGPQNLFDSETPAQPPDIRHIPRHSAVLQQPLDYQHNNQGYHIFEGIHNRYRKSINCEDFSSDLPDYENANVRESLLVKEEKQDDNPSFCWWSEASRSFSDGKFDAFALDNEFEERGVIKELKEVVAHSKGPVDAVEEGVQESPDLQSNQFDSRFDDVHARTGSGPENMSSGTLGYGRGSEGGPSLPDIRLRQHDTYSQIKHRQLLLLMVVEAAAASLTLLWDVVLLASMDTPQDECETFLKHEPLVETLVYIFTRAIALLVPHWTVFYVFYWADRRFHEPFTQNWDINLLGVELATAPDLSDQDHHILQPHQ